MKNLILVATVFVSMNVFAANSNPTVNEKVLYTFNQVFKEAQNVHWNTTAMYSEASFESGNVKTKAFLDEDGNLVQTIRYYKEDKLPANILYNIQRKYCQEVWGVTEVSNSHSTTYNVVLKCKKYWYQVKADADGRVELITKYTRGDI